MTIVVTGSVAFDYIMSFPGRFTDHILPDKLDRISLSFLVDDMRRVYGGCAPNIAYSLALLGERPMIMATAGRDAEPYRDWLAESGVDTSLLCICDDCFTASFFVSTDRDQNQIASFYTGAMARACELSMYAVPDAEIAILSPNDPAAMVKYADECRTLGIPYIYDPGQQVARVGGDELLAGLTGAQILIMNDYEYSILQIKTGLDEGQLLDRVGTIIITQGEDGSRIVSGDGQVWVPIARPHAVREPTGVGDAYRAGLIVGRVHGYPWPVTGRIAALAAAYVIEEPGPQPKPYTLPEFVARYRENFGHTPELDDL
ncbi:MAG: carbohydrate kinase family protein, partial [Anaerolineae bacterium]|nr:carbohydrate kinase family protein [Anaerolineae bacterium]